MKGVVIVSGGMDSITLLKDLYQKGNELKALSFYYGQKHKKELLFAQEACRNLGVDHKIIDITEIRPLISNSALTGKVKMPHGHYADETMKLTVVPNRNMIMLSIAIGYAENLQYECVFYGAHSGDHAIYPDCRPEFVEAVSKAAELGTYNKIKIVAPYSQLSKGEIALIGLHLGINYDRESWTCYEGRDLPCGQCGACVERKEAIDYAAGKIASQSPAKSTKVV